MYIRYKNEQLTRGLFHVTIARLTDVRSRRRENARALSPRTFACSTLRGRYTGRTYDQAKRWNRIINLDVLKAMCHDESECITSTYFYHIDICPKQGNTYLKF